MARLKTKLETIDLHVARRVEDICKEVASLLFSSDYQVVIEDHGRPWGGFNQLSNADADRFIEEFFPGLTPEQARLGNSESELSPKILVVKPGQRLSWQYHDRRAERWAYVTAGGFFKSLTDDQGDLQLAKPGDIVQFAKSERHRLVGAEEHYTLVAEIWQHTDPKELSNEGDIVRLEDDYSRLSS